MTTHLLLRRASLLSVLVMAVLVHVAASAAPAPDRVALVIGNADYPHAPLLNPVNDARAMSRALRRLGFEVFSLENADKQRMEQAIVRFAGRLNKETSGLFFYAGHGVQVNGRNYLVPVDADINSEREIRIETVGVNLVLDEMAYADNRINIVILDACRNNPFERRLRGSSRGLAAIDAARGTLIAYATSPGSVALDGDGSNGVYTEELLRALEEPGLEVEKVFKRVRVGVARRTNQQQIPWESSSLTGNFVFNLQGKSSTVMQSAPQKQAELVYWQSISTSDNPDAFRAYLRQFPQGTFAGLARIRIEELEPTSPGAVQPDFASAGVPQASSGPSDADPVPDIGATPAPGELLAKARPSPQASAGIARQLPFVIGIVAPNGTIWAGCGQFDGADSLARNASKHVQKADGFTFLNRWGRAENTGHLWKKSGLRLKPVDEAVFTYGQSYDLDGVLVLRYETGGTYCEHVRIEAYLFDVGRKTNYRQEGSVGEIPEMTEKLVAEFSSERKKDR